MGEPGRFRDATLIRIRQPDHTGGAALPVAYEKGHDLRLCCAFCRLAFPSRVRDVGDPRGSSEYTQKAGVWFAKTLADCEINDLAALPPLFCYNS